MTIPKDKSRQSQEALKSQIVVTLQKKNSDSKTNGWNQKIEGYVKFGVYNIIWVVLPPSHNAIVTTRMTFILFLGYPNLNRHLEPSKLLGRGTTQNLK